MDCAKSQGRIEVQEALQFQKVLVHGHLLSDFSSKKIGSSRVVTVVDDDDDGNSLGGTTVILGEEKSTQD